MEERYNFIIEIIKEAGRLVKAGQEEHFQVSTKGGDPRDIVTSVDLKVGQFITEKIKNKFPTEVVLSEETNEEARGQSFWSLDPIDGTSNFARRIPHFAVVISYLENDQPVVGAVFNPITNELFSFKKGAGAFLNDKSISVTETTEVASAYTILHIGRKEEVREWGISLQRDLLAKGKKTINLASSALDLCFLAAGRVDAVIYGTISTRDVAVAVTMVREAGGEVYNLGGEPISFLPEPQQIIATATKELFSALKNLMI